MCQLSSQTNCQYGTRTSQISNWAVTQVLADLATSRCPTRIGLPDSFTIGETVSIPYSLSWQYENGTTKYERLGLPTPDVYEGQLGMLISDEFTVLDDNAVTVVGYGDRYSPHTGAMIYITTTSSEMTYNGTLNLRLDTAMYHDRDTILFLMYSDVYHFQVQRTDTGVTSSILYS